MNIKSILNEMPHRRLNLLTGEWTLVSPHRVKRPWQGKQETLPQEKLPQYDPDCYLCPGNERANGNWNPNYQNTFVFTNDFAALLPDVSKYTLNQNSFFKVISVRGISLVICFSPRHDISLAEMEVQDISKVIKLWIDQTNELGKNYCWIQIFENKGDIMGCSNPHPHGQIWASNHLPNEPCKENHRQNDYFIKNSSVLLLDYLEREIVAGERIVIENEYWIVLVPFWAVWPFETILFPKRHVLRLPELSSAERKALADILKRHLIRYDNLFEIPFPYTMGWHGAPMDAQNYDHWQLHCHFYPPLLRSSTVKKFMVGYEMLAEAQRDVTPELAARQLQNLSDIHYKQRQM